MRDRPAGIAEKTMRCQSFEAPVPRSAFTGVTVIIGFSFRKLFSPMPRMFIRSSTFLKLPFFWRY